MKNIDVHTKIESLDQKIEKRPTLLQAISMAGIVIGITFSLFTFITSFLLNNQADKISAVTKTVIIEEIAKYGEGEEKKWASREKTVVERVLITLGLR